MTSTMTINEHGAKEWRDEFGQYHRTRGPALIGPVITGSDRDRVWYQHGLPHRLNGPAIITAEGRKEWYQEGERHRLDGPAVTLIDGYKEWWVNGIPHNDNGPAITGSGGYKKWLVNGKRHRLDGPAIINSGSGRPEWYINDRGINDDVEEFMSVLGLPENWKRWTPDTWSKFRLLSLLSRRLYFSEIWEWIEEQRIPYDLTQWNDADWVMFNLRFRGQ